MNLNLIFLMEFLKWYWTVLFSSLELKKEVEPGVWIMDKQLDQVAPIMLKGTALIPLKVDISKLFGTNKIKFQISIRDNKIIIESPKILANLDNQDRHLEPEAIIIGWF